MPTFDFIPIIEVCSPVLFAKERPVASGIAACAPLLQKGAERRNPGTWTDHDHGNIRLRGRTEAGRLLHKNRHSCIAGEVGKKRRANAFARPVFTGVTYCGYGDMHLPQSSFGAG